MRVGYARVSTEKTEQDISIDAQVQQLLAAGCEHVIRERGTAYREDAKRPGWEELQTLVASGRCTEVMAISQSRLSRRGEELPFLRMCARLEVGVRFLDGTPGDPTDPAGRLLTGVLSTVNEVDSMIKSINIKNGLKRRKAAGYYGCGKAPFGYVVTDGKVQPSPRDWEAARMMWLQLMDLDMNVTAWIRRYGMPWTVQGVRKWIANPILRGAVRGDWNATEALVSWQEWERAQTMLKVRANMRGSTAHRFHLFTGLVKCEQCGRSLHNVIQKGRQPRLKCMAPHCAWYGRGLRVSVVRERVIAALAGRHQQLAELASSPVNTETPEQQRISGEIATLEQVAHLPGVAALIEQQKAQLAAMRVQPAGPRLEMLSALFADQGTLKLATDQELRAIVMEFVASIVWPGGLESLTITLR